MQLKNLNMYYNVYVSYFVSVYEFTWLCDVCVCVAVHAIVRMCVFVYVFACV